ncbi:MAG: UbiA family prenyltransferase [Bacteroidales bacterium]
MNKQGQGSYVAAYLKLGKFTISIPVALTGFLGYFLYKPTFDPGAVLSILGILTLSMGSSALNQIQERHIDARMKRTSGRPIPAGIINVPQAVIFAIVMAVIGTVLLTLTGSQMAAAIGLFTLAWYNLVYTPLKRITAFAVVPGAVIGALPPIIGWTAAGGYPLQMEIMFVAFFLFVGQMPHFWLLLLKIGNQYQEAGLPVITSLLEPRQIRNLSFVWIAATGVIVLMLPVTPIIHNTVISMVLVVATIVFLIRMFQLTFRGELLEHWKMAFITVNLFYLVIILTLIADRIV